MTKEGLDMLKGFEALRLKAYKCPAGVWTIGYGHTDGVKEGDVVTEEVAEDMLVNDVAYFERMVGLLVKVSVNDHQMDALVSLCYNIGVAAFRGSTLLKMVNRNKDDPKIKDEFIKWRMAKGKVLPGLVKRRAKEAEMYFMK